MNLVKFAVPSDFFMMRGYNIYPVPAVKGQDLYEQDLTKLWGRFCEVLCRKQFLNKDLRCDVRGMKILKEGTLVRLLSLSKKVRDAFLSLSCLELAMRVHAYIICSKVIDPESFAQFLCVASAFKQYGVVERALMQIKKDEEQGKEYFYSVLIFYYMQMAAERGQLDVVWAVFERYKIGIFNAFSTVSCHVYVPLSRLYMRTLGQLQVKDDKFITSCKEWFPNSFSQNELEKIYQDAFIKSTLRKI